MSLERLVDERAVAREGVNRTIPHVGVVYAGGTISSIQTKFGYREGGHIRNLMEMLQERNPMFINGRFTLGEPRVVFTGLSENMTRKDRKTMKQTLTEMVDSGEYTSIVVTHGTDSLDETARLDLAKDKEFMEKLRAAGVKIIITGAEHDADHPETDVWGNLEGSLDTAVDDDLEPGVYVSFHGRVIPAERVIKKPYTGSPSKFDFLDEKGPEYAEAWGIAQKRMFDLEFELEYHLEKMYGREALGSSAVRWYVVSMDRTDHSSIRKDLWGHEPTRAILLELYHSGTANTTDSPLAIHNLVKQMRQERPGLVFFAGTENHEPVDLHAYETSVKLREAGVVPLYDMPSWVARTKLRWAVKQSQAPQDMIDLMLKNQVGEIDESRIHWDDINELKKLYGEN